MGGGRSCSLARGYWSACPTTPGDAPSCCRGRSGSSPSPTIPSSPSMSLGGRGRKNRLQKANAFVIYMLGELVETCEAKQVNLEAKVICSSSIPRALAREAEQTDAKFLVVGRSRSKYHRNHFEVANYCFMHAPNSCSVIAVGREGLAQTQSSNRLKSQSFDGSSNISSSSTWSRTLTKLLRSSSIRKQ
uniref:Uncharacterized protein n=1 Tax=Aegilops tauschii subsp. strangulata TaxID=200361 RepID=A0A453T3Z0_AEGTS